MKKRLVGLSLLIIIIVVISLELIGCREVQQKVRAINEDEIITIYTYDNQNKLLKEVEELKEAKDYTLDNPLILNNPFETNTTALYVYFKSEVPSMLEYTVHVSDKKINDFTRVLYNGGENNLTTEHEYSLIGLIGGMKNKISLNLYNEDNEIIGTKKINIKIPELSGKGELFLNKDNGESNEKLSEGLFVTLGYIKSKEYKSYLYDNDGVARGELNLENYRIDRLLFKDNLLYMSTNINKISGVNRLGYAEKNYDLGKYELHHDYIFGKDNTMLILASNSEKDSIEDIVIELNLENGEIRELLDLGNLFSEYKNTALMDEDKGKIDWIHINSISLINETDVLLSSRETSTLIRINNIYDNPQIGYMIGHKSFWEGTPYSEYLLIQDGEFIINGGQHDAEVIYDNSLGDNQYYIDLFNNNIGYSSSNTLYDWSQIKGINSDKSMYYRYLIDETNRTFSLVDQLIVEKSNYISNVQHYDNHLIIDSGNNFTFSEYDSTKKLIAKFTIEQEIWGLYRCYKESFNNFYFYNV